MKHACYVNLAILVNSKRPIAMISPLHIVLQMGAYTMRIPTLTLLGLMVATPIAAQDAPAVSRANALLYHDLVICSAFFSVIADTEIGTQDMKGKSERLLIAAVKADPERTPEKARSQMENTAEGWFTDYGMAEKQELEKARPKLAECDAFDAKYGVDPK